VALTPAQRIYRRFAGRDNLAREIFLSRYGWYCGKLQRIVSGPGGTMDKLQEIVRHEFSAATEHSEAFVYLCENEARFVRSLVLIQNLNPDVLMMEPAEDWHRCDAAKLLRPPKIRNIFIQ